MTFPWIFDLLLCALLVGLAARALFSRTLFQGVMFFVVFGLVMALAWARLRAPDIALAEAALGAGITGALLFSAVRALRDRGDEEEC
ncbi:MAG: DUF4040 domain-containing protein [Kiritimatiellae bacterium]|nr:DUF4040 domain-containing protein [Kiritimatiellia bacterium]MDW8457782.1 DUF4040 domain-containing protein [Verrucomicrobiota bacterium]